MCRFLGMVPAGTQYRPVPQTPRTFNPVRSNFPVALPNRRGGEKFRRIGTPPTILRTSAPHSDCVFPKHPLDENTVAMGGVEFIDNVQYNRPSLPNPTFFDSIPSSSFARSMVLFADFRVFACFHVPEKVPDGIGKSHITHFTQAIGYSIIR